MKNIESLKLKNIIELAPKDQNNKDARSLNLNFDKNQELEIYESDTDLDMNIIAEKNIQVDISIIMKKEGSTLKINTIVDEGANLRISCFSKKEITTRYETECKENSRFEAINISLNTINSKTTTKLKNHSTCLIVNSYYNKESKHTTDIKDTVIHEGKNTKSLINSKGYLINSKADSRGLIIIRPEAFEAQGFQESNILLEGDSNAISVPDLEILNNEVKCSHGSTISRIKDEDLFYFESRGINKNVAKKIIIKGHILSTVPETNPIIEYAKKFIEEEI